MDAIGGNGQVHFDGSTVRISRDGFGGSSSHLEPWSMAVTGIVEVAYHEPGKIIPGFIAFVTRGFDPPTNYVSATKEQHAVVFKHQHSAEFEALRDAVTAALR